MSIINPRRLRDYPRLMLIATWLILGVNLLLHQGWIGAFGQVIGGDFIMFYSTGLIHISAPQAIYDYDTQTHTQQALVVPSILPGYNPYMNPPFVAPVYSLLTFLSLNWALAVWTILAVLSVLLAVYWLYKLYALNQQTPALPYGQLIIIVLSFFPFVEGLEAGQNHWLTLLLVTGVIYAMFKDKWFLAGAFAGLLIYKPQFVLGFVIIWLLWKKLKTLLTFGAIAIGWAGLYALIYGLKPFTTYVQLSQAFMDLPYIPGFPNYLLVTFYGFLTSIFPQSVQPVLSAVSQALLVLYSAGLAWLAYRYRKSGMPDKIPVIVAAILLPLVATPYALLHDMVILIPAFVLWSIYSKSRLTLYASIIIYLGAFILTFVGALTKFAWVSILIIGLFTGLIIWFYNRYKFSSRTVLAQ
jgi:hypothetical protein